MGSDPLRVPKSLQGLYDEISGLTDALCAERLGAEYRDLARRMVAALCRKRPSPLATGQARVWAAGIVYTLGRINFLTDRSSEPYLATADLASHFGVGQSTVQGKAKLIREALGADRMSTQWLLPSRVSSHPLVWLLTVNGLVVDVRDMPREVQEIALAQKLIPFIPDEPDH